MTSPLNVKTLGPNKLGGLPVRKVMDRAPHVNMLVYGEFGVGKTRLLGTADDVPEMRKVLILDAEGGMLSVSGTNPNVESVRFENWQQLQDMYTDLINGSWEQYNTICLDSGSEAQAFNLQHVMGIAIDKKDTHDEDLMQIQDWGRSLVQMRRMVRGFRDLPVNFIMTALVKDVKVDAVRTKKGPDFSGKFAQEVGALMDLVLYMYTKRVDEEDKRLLLTRGTETAIAKDRSDNLPVVVAEPHMRNIYKPVTSPKAKATV